MEFRTCFYRKDGTKRLFHITDTGSYEIILKKYFKGMEKREHSWLIEKFGALYTDEQTFEKYYTLYQQGDLFHEVKN